MQTLSVATTENWPTCLGHYRRRGDAPYKKRYAYVPNGGALGACLETISYVYDTETGWYYLQSRYYDPEVGRFLSADVLLSTGQGVLGHNTFAYCLNNPVNMSDPSGYSSEDEEDEDGDGIPD